MIQNKKNVVFSFFDPESGKLMDKQYNFYRAAMLAARGESERNILFFGGGIRGGKTFTCLFTLLMLAKEFPGIRIHIIRDSTPNLMHTTYQSMMKLCKNYKKLSQDKSNFYIEFHNSSRIYFFPESIDKDKDLDRFKGLETNVFFLEQIEELSEKTFQKAQERVGSWRFPGAPAPIILSTFNPTHVRWIRDLVYKPYKASKIPENNYIEFITAAENPFVVDAQWKMWEGMDSMHYKQYVEGDWEVFENLRAFCYAFDTKKHVAPIELRKSEIYLSFDFNVDPSVCLCAYKNGNRLEIFKEFRIENSNVYELCDRIYEITKGATIYITGDSTGKNRSFNLPDGLNTYDQIMKLLNVTRHCMHVPRKNLGIRDSRLMCNAALEHLEISIDPSCVHLIEDLLTVEADFSGDIDRKLIINKTNDPTKSHLLDCFRYYIHTYYLEQFQKAVYKYE